MVDSFDPSAYGRTRNFKNGSVSKLSPYISRGVISTRFVFESLKQRYGNLAPFEKFIQELAWRDHWQRSWQMTNVDSDLKRKQEDVAFYGFPERIFNGEIGIDAIDEGVRELYEKGYVHNHMRMYLASIVCNFGKYHWNTPAKWMYYYLLDGDWASNALSWQWVAGTNSNKKYIANQENINKYFDTNDRGTFLDHPYDSLYPSKPEENLTPSISLELKTKLPESSLTLDPDKPVVLYTTYNLDPNWLNGIEANRVLILEPTHFEKYPISPQVLDFILSLAENISNIQLFVGSYLDFCGLTVGQTHHFKEHPFYNHFVGVKHEREWLSRSVASQSSFFKYWNKLKKDLL
jgi:deoxyribodipyrimidine photo-lyase